MKAVPQVNWLTLAALLIPATLAALLVVTAVVWAACHCTLGRLPDFSNGG